MSDHLPTVIGNLIVNEVAPKRIESPQEDTLTVYPLQIGHHMEWEDEDGTRHVHDTPIIWPDGYQPRKPSKPDPYSWIKPEQIAEIVVLLIKGSISHGAVKQVIAELHERGGEVRGIIEQYGLWQSHDGDEVKRWVIDAIAANPKAAAGFKSGNEKALNAIKGAVMKTSQGKANPRLVDEMLRTQLNL